jgi:NAD+ diphosphatase
MRRFSDAAARAKSARVIADPFSAPLPQLAVGFTGNRLDRDDRIRRDPEALWAMTMNPTARWLVLDELCPVVRANGDAIDLYWARRSEAPQGESVFLGLDHAGAPHFAVAGSGKDLDGGEPMDARALAMRLGDARAGIVAQARSLLDWHARHRFCAVCGGPTKADKGGYARACQACSAEHFPRTDPVVIMLSIHGDRCLLGRQPRFPKGFLSALAGFVEPGESLEEAVARELYEEAGIRTGRVRYVASQPWPFPSSLMIGAFAEATSTDIRIDETELEQVVWMSRDDVRSALAGQGPFNAPPPLAIAHTLLKAWIDL